jgi:hypothetical protein
MIKRILAPVLAFVGFGLTASANGVPYCDNFCGGNNTAAFSSALATDSYSYVSMTDLTFTGSLSGGNQQYVDGPTAVMFAASSAFTINSMTLVTAANKVLTISVPAGFPAIQLFLSQTGGGNIATTYTDSSLDLVNLTSTPLELDYLNTAPGSGWTITLTPATSGEQITVDSFNPAGAQSQSDTPEVGTLLLIGAGLISMRWMRRAQLHFSGPPQIA